MISMQLQKYVFATCCTSCHGLQASTPNLCLGHWRHQSLRKVEQDSEKGDYIATSSPMVYADTHEVMGAAECKGLYCL